MLFYVFLFTITFVQQVIAWSGYDYDKNNFIEIEEEELVREGETIEFFDYQLSEYRNMDVESINRYGSSVEIEGIDSESGESRTFEMD